MSKVRDMGKRPEERIVNTGETYLEDKPREKLAISDS